VTAKGRQMETESAPIRYVAELLGVDTDSGRRSVVNSADGLLLRCLRHSAHGRDVRTEAKFSDET
jgi:hypothetical protein